MALSNKRNEINLTTTQGEEENKVTSAEESKGTAQQLVPPKLGDTFSIQIDHNYINGVSPLLDIISDEEFKTE